MAGIAAAIVVGSAGFDEAAKARRFDRNVWLQPTEFCTTSARGRIVDDLVATHLKVGMPMSSVRTFLGAADEVTETGVWFYNVSAEYNGFLPRCVGLELDTARGHLAKATVTRDD
ncbi:MAG TPA: hypothetical protein VK488_04950 [Gaiellaceae bacterium]|nr:hypothetical protein [Gaiellaceae bacterium]